MYLYISLHDMYEVVEVMRQARRALNVHPPHTLALEQLHVHVHVHVHVYAWVCL